MYATYLPERHPRFTPSGFMAFRGMPPRLTPSDATQNQLRGMNADRNLMLSFCGPTFLIYNTTAHPGREEKSQQNSL